MMLEEAVSVMEVLKRFYGSSIFSHIYWLYLIPTSLLLLREVMWQVWEECHGRVRHRISLVCFVPVVNVFALVLIVILWQMWLFGRVNEYFNEHIFGEIRENN